MPKPTTSRQANRLKNLSSQRNRLARSVACMSKDPARDQRKYKSVCDELEAVSNRLDSLQATQLTMSEHSLLRYMQRALGIDLDAIIQHVITPKLKQQIEICGDGLYPIGEGCRARVVNKTIVTVLGK